MLRGVTNRSETTRCQKLLEDTLSKRLNLEVCVKIGRRGTSDIRPVKHNRTVWFTSEKRNRKKKFWNVFGLNPDKSKQNNIVVEINIPTDGIDLRIGAGMFAVDEKGSVFLLHSGRIGGGRQGINKTNFLAWYSQYVALVDIKKGTKVVEGILIGNIFEKKDLIKGLTKFIKDVNRFKIEYVGGI